MAPNSDYFDRPHEYEPITQSRKKRADSVKKDEGSPSTNAPAEMPTWPPIEEQDKRGPKIA